jgi:hypothetical protein
VRDDRVVHVLPEKRVGVEDVERYAVRARAAGEGVSGVTPGAWWPIARGKEEGRTLSRGRVGISWG